MRHGPPTMTGRWVQQWPMPDRPEGDRVRRRCAPSRRTFLLLGAGIVLVGCRPGKRSPVPTRVDPDVALSASMRADEAGLIAAYDAALRAFPPLAPALVPLREQHEEHLGALPPNASASASAPPSPAPVPAIPTDPAAALRSLAATERAAAAARIADCLAASSRLAPLIAAIGASEAAHASALATVRPAG